eukprot:scaffold71110_cov61-Phaeocystis_antarctica.AAC.2
MVERRAAQCVLEVPLHLWRGDNQAARAARAWFTGCGLRACDLSWTLNTAPPLSRHALATRRTSLVVRTMLNSRSVIGPSSRVVEYIGYRHRTWGAPHGTRYVRHARGTYTVVRYLTCAPGTYNTREAGTRSLCVQYGGSGTYV